MQVRRPGALSRDASDIEMSRFAQAAQCKATVLSGPSSFHGKVLRCCCDFHSCSVEHGLCKTLHSCRPLLIVFVELCQIRGVVVRATSSEGFLLERRHDIHQGLTLAETLPLSPPAERIVIVYTVVGLFMGLFKWFVPSMKSLPM